MQDSQISASHLPMPGILFSAAMGSSVVSKSLRGLAQGTSPLWASGPHLKHKGS